MEYELFQQRLFSALVRWTNVVLVVGILANSYRALVYFQNTLFITSAGLLMILIGVWCLYLARRGRMRLASRLYLLCGMGLLALVSLSISQIFILNVAMGFYLLVLIGMFLEQPQYIAWWAGAGVVFYVAGLTLRILLPFGELTYSTADIVGLYLFPVIFLWVFGLLGHRLSGRLRKALTESGVARTDLWRGNQELREAQSLLEAANEQLHHELAERLRIERHLQDSQQELQAVLQQKESLLQEVHHRVKNNLQVISSLLDMQSYYTQDPQALHALQESRSRVRTMAFVHERLCRSPDLASVDAREYLCTIADHLLSLYADCAECIDLSVEVDDISLDLDTAIPCGLIANELVTNALQHAFPDVGECSGEVRVALRSQNNGTMQLTVSDNGVSLPAGVTLASEKSLGLRVVQMLTRQLDGAIELQTGNGTTITITFAWRNEQSTMEERR